ncbi:NAD-dependent epimerase/dehydratase family protein [Kordiimonas lacus]|uniref:Nucleoside-diphosphate-sugar epimerase n=1 Tax=Kordiimonas lacus TaxID=637679 RepID=A0A1G6VKH7_9PROT|nr:NAD(P)-dependent oxidoreductase [Kordiimonas lacus]SDD53893.1 Nucleoside-diphosphate-sugar epimerase [Kordiimonas lacus]
MAKTSASKGDQKTVALTGATGFLGGHAVDCYLEAGYKVKALTRRHQAARDGVTWVSGDLDDDTALKALCDGTDVLVHIAGLTKALNRDIFFDVNVGGTKRLMEIAAKAGVGHVVHVSSMAAREPMLSHYGASKRASELVLTARNWPFTWTIVRPPAIYGPGDKEILKLFKALKYRLLPAPGSRHNRFAMIHGRDMASALVALSDGKNKSAVLELDDGKSGGYTLADVAEALGGKHDKPPFILPIPFPILGLIGFINGLIATIIRRPVMLTMSTARYLCHKDWTVRNARRPHLTNWAPQYDLKAGLKSTIDWYRKNGLL